MPYGDLGLLCAPGAASPHAYQVHFLSVRDRDYRRRQDSCRFGVWAQCGEPTSAGRSSGVRTAQTSSLSPAGSRGRYFHARSPLRS
jgi:hypothetical protein